ncbi:MAG: YggT family protein [Vampirovibrionales bacterium]
MELSFYNLQQLLISLIGLLKGLLFIRLILTWVPNLNWYQQPFRLLATLIDPILLPFRALIPPIGGIDLSPMVPFFLLGLIEQMIPKVFTLIAS